MNDWLSQFLQMICVTASFELCGNLRVPWSKAELTPGRGEMLCYVVLHGQAVLQDPHGQTARVLLRGDIALLRQGAGYALHGARGQTVERHSTEPLPAESAPAANEEGDEPCHLLCGRFFVGTPHDRLIREYLPAALIVRSADCDPQQACLSIANRLARLVTMLCHELADDKPGADTVLNAFGLVLLALVLQAGCESPPVPKGLLALAASPQLTPVIHAMFIDPARPWTLPELARLGAMSRSTFIRRFQEKTGRSPFEWLNGIRMSLAANRLADPTLATKVVASAIGYRSSAAFRRAFFRNTGFTPREWQRRPRTLGCMLPLDEPDPLPDDRERGARGLDRVCDQACSTLK